MKINKPLAFVLGICLLLTSVLIYVRWLYPYANFEQILNVITSLTPDVIKQNILPEDYFWGLLFFIMIFPLVLWKTTHKQQIVIILADLIFIAFFSGFAEYVYYINKITDLYEKEYIHPNDIKFTFPQKKRNLVLIIMESFEQNFSNEQYYEQNLLQNLTSLQNDGNYSTNNYQLKTTNYSITALTAMHCGIPYRLSKNNDIRYSKYFLPRAVCFPEILKQNGYHNEIIKAADIKYSHADLFAKTHGYTKVLGRDELKKMYPQFNNSAYQGTFDGLNDRALFEAAKMELQKLNKKTPFALTLFSLDTHGRFYYLDKSCKAEFNDLRDAFMCSDKAAYDFVTWLQMQPFAQNTTIVILGDHWLGELLSKKDHSNHGIYNVFLNLPQGLAVDKHKKFTTLDLAPTILEAMNIKLSSRAFGLGRSIFADNNTLIEKLGTGLDYQMISYSDFYENLTTPPEQKIKYSIYPLGTRLFNKDVLHYTDYYEEVFGKFYIDELNFKLDKMPQANLIMKLKFAMMVDNDLKLIFNINDQEVFVYEPTRNNNHEISFNINKDLINADNTLRLKIKKITQNNTDDFYLDKTNLASAAHLGIAIQELSINSFE